MPDRKFLDADVQQRMFGDPTWQQQMADRWAKSPGGMLMFAMGILSDAQEVMDIGLRNNLSADRFCETTRQYLNKAKHVMREYCVTKPMAREVATLNALLNEQDYHLEPGQRQDLRWLMDCRR